MSQSEHHLQSAVANYLSYATDGLHEFRWYAVPNGGKRHLNTARKLKREGVKAGVGDIAICWRGRHIEIELKTVKGRQSSDQKDWQTAITLAGGVYHVCRSVDEVEDFLDALGVPIRARLTKRRTQEQREDAGGID